MPDSVEPIASVITRSSGSSSASCSFTVCEKIAAVLLNENERREVDVVLHLLERVGERARHRVAGDADHVDAVLLDECATSPRRRTCRRSPRCCPRRVTRKIENWPAPCMSGGIGRLDQPARRVGSIFSLAVVRCRDPLARDRVDAAAERVVHVFLAPHHALRHAGGAARVEQVHVVVGALAEVAFRASPTRSRPRTRSGRARSRRRRSRPTRCGRSAAASAARRARRPRAGRTRAGTRARRGRSCRRGSAAPPRRSGSSRSRRGPGSCRSRTSPRPTRCSSWPGCRRGRRPSRPRSESVCAKRVARSSSSR